VDPPREKSPVRYNRHCQSSEPIPDRAFEHRKLGLRDFLPRLPKNLYWPTPTRMTDKLFLEICAPSIERALPAERAGADRVELCCDLASGGVTPSAGVMRLAGELLHLPIHVLIRPRPGNFVYSSREVEAMRRDIQTIKELGMDGIVVGILDEKSRVDVKRNRELVRLAEPLPVTFHRAFDQIRHVNDSLEAVIDTGAKRILTSGGKKNAIAGISRLARLVEAARGRIIIMPGGGIRPSNLARIVRETGVREVHTSLGASDASNNQRDATTLHTLAYETKVRRMVQLLRMLRREKGEY
jgi:copper homeostasis protein